MKDKQKLHSIALASVILIFVFLILISSVASAAQVAAQVTRIGNGSDPAVYDNKVVWTDSGVIHVYDLTTKTDTAVDSSAASNPNIYGNKLVWYDGIPRLAVYDISTATKTYITKDVDSWSKPAIYGNRIVWSANGGVYMRDISTSTQTRVTNGTDPDIYDTRIAYSYDGIDAEGIYVYDIITNETILARHRDGNLYRPHIYGNKVIWSDFYTRMGYISMYNINTKETIDVTSDNTGNTLPEYANSYADAGDDTGTHIDINGDKIVYSKTGDDQFGYTGVYVYDIPSAKSTPVYIYPTGTATTPDIYNSIIVWGIEGSYGEVTDNGIYMSDLSATNTLPPVAEFTANVTSGTVPLVMLFTDLSTGGVPTSWYWDFGDGINSKHAMNATHTFTKPGKYTINLTVGNNIGNSTATKPGYIVVTGPNTPVANFSTNVTDGYVPLSVQFTDLSEYATGWDWDFGDGNVSTDQNPTHTYSETGTYTVNLNVSNAHGSTSKLSTINVLKPPVYAYITNMRSNNVSIIDTSTDTVVTTLNVGHYPLGVVVAPDGTKAYVANAEGTVSIIDTSTNNVIGTVETGDYPYGIAITPDGTKVYIVNSRGSKSISVIDTSTNAVTATVPVGDTSLGVAVSPDGTKVYVTNYFSHSISIIDTATNNVIGTVNVGDFPVGVAVTPDGKKVYVAKTNYLFLGSGIYSTCTVSVIDTTTNNVTAVVEVGASPSGIAVNPTGTKVYVANYASKNVSVINTATDNVTASVNVGFCPCGVAVTPDGTKVYVANQGSNNVSVIDTATNNVIDTVNVGYSPVAFGQFIGEKSIFSVSNFSANTKQAIPELTEADNGRKINLNKGDIFYLTLPEKPGTSYDLQLELSSGLTILSDKSVLINPPAYFEDPGGIMGVDHIWKIKVNSEGNKQIKGVYIQPVSRKVDETYTVYLEIGSGGSSGGSGGSGSTGSSPEPARNVDVKELCQVFVTNGKTAHFDFTKNATCVVSVSFDAKKTTGKTTTIAEQLKGKSTLVPELPAGETYKSFNVWVGNGGVATSKNIENPVVCFKVEKSWIKDKKIDQDSITLNRYNDKKWKKSPVNLSGEDDKFLYFTAKTSGFSSFAITSTSKPSPEETVTKTEIDYPETINKNNTTDKEPQNEQKEILSTPGFEIYYGVAGLLAVFLYKRK